MCEIANERQQETQVLPTEIEIKAESEQTEIYSDGSVHSDGKKRRGMCYYCLHWSKTLCTDAIVKRRAGEKFILY